MHHIHRPTYIRAYIHAYTLYTYTHTYVAYMHSYIHEIHLYVVHAYINTHRLIHTYISLHICMHIGTYSIYVHEHIYVRRYIHTCNRTIYKRFESSPELNTLLVLTTLLSVSVQAIDRITTSGSLFVVTTVPGVFCSRVQNCTLFVQTLYFKPKEKCIYSLHATATTLYLMPFL
jgi:hypothetical protein